MCVSSGQSTALLIEDSPCAASILLLCLHGAATASLVWVRLAGPVRRLARGAAGAHLSAPLAVLAGGP